MSESINLNDYIPGITATTGLNEVSVIGKVDLLKDPKAAIFNSRQGKTPDSSAEWLRTTLHLAEKLAANNAVLISSLGMVTWEAAAWKASDAGGRLILLIPDIDPGIAEGFAAKIIEDFDFDESRLLMIFPDPDIQSEKKYRKLPKRDFWIASIADRIYPVSVRKGGNQSRIVELFSIIHDKVNTKFQIEHTKAGGALFNPGNLPKLIAEDGQEWTFLTHFTRTSITPWQDEKKSEFYRSIDEGGAGYSHSGLNTLCKILRDMNILATDKLIRGSYEVISFTECAPWEMKKLIKYRPGLQRWTFEPYGLAINKEKLESHGIRKVIYGFDYQYRFLQGIDKAYFQSVDSEDDDWRAEKEWRCIGNLDLKQFQPEDVTIIVQTFEEAEKLNEWSPFPVKYWEQLGKVEETNSK